MPPVMLNITRSREEGLSMTGSARPFFFSCVCICTPVGEIRQKSLPLYPSALSPNVVEQDPIVLIAFGWLGLMAVLATGFILVGVQ